MPRQDRDQHRSRRPEQDVQPGPPPCSPGRRATVTERRLDWPPSQARRCLPCRPPATRRHRETLRLLRPECAAHRPDALRRRRARQERVGCQP
ncbi:hypothetical protein E2C06_36625 [Dankookia rubra]|uniref:Uncharacterized protein n=1 Tax=Dankookia rubra TaxID=1442381 RepID=A0A4R5PZB1_9PROT|nr:hypothetical protein E2C06_36625 [Dankookia rubra]